MLKTERGMTLEATLRNLGETIAWCDARADATRPKDSLRNPAFYNPLEVRDLPVKLRIEHPVSEEPRYFVQKVAAARTAVRSTEPSRIHRQPMVACWHMNPKTISSMVLPS